VRKAAQSIQDIAVSELTETEVLQLLPLRKKDGNKGDNGRALLIAGSHRYTGAALMSAGAALRCGCGLLTVLGTATVKSAFCMLPEAMCVQVCDGKEWEVESVDEIKPYMESAQALAVGPGMGQGSGVAEIVRLAIETGKPLVLDADGLNALARNKELLQGLHQNCILTPHVGEMARLTGKTISEIKEDFIGTAAYYAKLWDCTVLLKEAQSIIASQRKITRNRTGNDGLSKGGSGDVLTGIILALLAQKAAPYDAARVGAYLLGLSAEKAFHLLQTRMTMARDLTDVLQQMFSGNKRFDFQ